MSDAFQQTDHKTSDTQAVFYIPEFKLRKNETLGLQYTAELVVIQILVRRSDDAK